MLIAVNVLYLCDFPSITCSCSVHSCLHMILLSFMLFQFPLPPSLGKEVCNVKLPDMPMGAASYGATIHNSKIYISAFGRDGNGKLISPVLVYSTNKHKWRTLPEQQLLAAIAVLDNHVTLLGGRDVSTGKFTNTPFTWYAEEGLWKQVLPPMPTGRSRPAAISHDNLLLVTGGLAEDDSTVLNTTDVLDLTSMTWSTPEGLNLPVPLWGHHLAFCGEYIYLVGGATVYPWRSSKDYNSQAWRAKWIDVKKTATSQHSQLQRDVWTPITDPPTLCPTPISCGGTLYTVGGHARDDKPISTVYTYITARNQWVSVGDMSVGRNFHCAVPLSSNTIFVAGGSVVHEGKVSFSSLTELLLL